MARCMLMAESMMSILRARSTMPDTAPMLLARASGGQGYRITPAPQPAAWAHRRRARSRAPRWSLPRRRATHASRADMRRDSRAPGRLSSSRDRALTAGAWQTHALMADLLDTIRSRIGARLEELRPLVEEAASLEAALAALEGSDGAAAPARPRRRASRTRSAGRRGRPRGATRERLAKSGELIKAARGYTAPSSNAASGLAVAEGRARTSGLRITQRSRRATRGRTSRAIALAPRPGPGRGVGSELADALLRQCAAGHGRTGR
jgi:hypothetical protein